MTPAAHLTDEQAARFRGRSLTASELLELDAHLSDCGACRDRLYAENRAFAGLRGLRSDLSVHLEYDGIVACSEGRGNPEQLTHIRQCAWCQAEVQDLSRFRTELLDTPRKPVQAPGQRWTRYRIPLGIAAAVLAIAGAATFALRRRDPAPQPTASVPTTQVDAALRPAEREILQAAAASGRLERAPVLDNLIPRTLLSQTAVTKTFYLLAPVGTTVLSDRPILRWTMSAAATSYVVSIFDEKFQKVAESQPLTTTEWHPADPLPRGKVLIWQVTARTPAGNVREPSPPTPEARFQIVAPDVAQHIESIRRDFPGNPLLLAALYAHAGALDDAESALQALDAMTSQSYRESLRKMRRPN
jgi:hypothetical protein